MIDGIYKALLENNKLLKEEIIYLKNELRRQKFFNLIEGTIYLFVIFGIILL